MTNKCLKVCENKTENGYCRTSVCINPKYNQQTVKAWLSRADYVQVVRCKDCKCSLVTKYGMECTCHGCDVVENDYCSWAERKEAEDE